jgi:YhcH/YjgK/YiaL family protein
MIVGELDNIEVFKTLSADIYSSLQLLRTLKPNVSKGSWSINSRVKMIVEEYRTECSRALEFESHKRVVDIQYAILGEERIFWSPTKYLVAKSLYDDENDSTTFINPSKAPSWVDVGIGTFAVMFESDGHSPKHCIELPQLIKKVTFKVSIN